MSKSRSSSQLQLSAGSMALLSALLVLGVLSSLVAEASANVPQEAVLKDPRFVNCMGAVNGPKDPNFMAVFTKCYSFAGRPRFGKRSGGWRNDYDSAANYFDDGY